MGDKFVLRTDKMCAVSYISNDHFMTENDDKFSSVCVNSCRSAGVYMRAAEEGESGVVADEESVLVTERETDKTPVMELLQRLSDSEPPPSQQQLQLRT